MGLMSNLKTAFQRLSQHLKHIAAELRKLIEEQDSVVRQRNFTGPWNGSAANQRLRRRRVVGRAHGTFIHQRDAVGKQSEGGIDARRFERLSARQ